jgi:hypothetical protein
MRLRPLTEAECYARCYGGHGYERVGVVRLPGRPSRSPVTSGERLRELFEERLAMRSPGSEAEAA